MSFLNFLTRFPSLVSFRRFLYRVLAVFDVFPQDRNPVTILCYHSISEDGPDAWKFGISRKMFQEQILSLQASGASFLSLTELEALLESNRLPQERSFVITFDDGYKDILLVREFLKEQGIRPALFVLSDPKNADRYEAAAQLEFLEPEEIIALKEDGWDIGCHSATHADFSTLDAIGEEREIKVAKRDLERDLGIPIRFFAYPKGWYSSRTKQAVETAGYRLALSMDDGFLSRSTDRFAVPRVGVDRTHTLSEFPHLFLVPAILFRRFIKGGLRILSRSW